MPVVRVKEFKSNLELMKRVVGGNDEMKRTGSSWSGLMKYTLPWTHAELVYVKLQDR